MSSTRSVVLVSLLMPVGMLLSLVSNWFIVWTFGLSPELDAYFVAFILPTFIGGVIADFLGRNFIPTLDRLRVGRPRKEVDGYISTVISFAALISIAGMGLLWLFMDSVVGLIAPGLGARHVELAANMARIMSFAIVFFSVNTFHEYLHQADRSYFKTQFVKFAIPVTTLGAVLLYGKQAGEVVLAWSFLIAHGLIFLVMLPGLNYRYRVTFGLRDPEVRSTIVSSGWLVLSGTISRARGFIENYLASQIGPGAVSAVALAIRITGPLQRAASLGMKMVAFRNASALVAAGRMEEAGHQSRQVVSVIIMLMLPVTLWLAADADLLVSLLFSARHFGGGELTMLIDATRGLVLAAPLMAVAPILSNLYFVLNRPMMVVMAAPITLATYAVFAFLLYKPWGVLGITLATFVIFAISFVAMSWHFSRLLHGFDVSRLWTGVIRQCLLAVGCVWGVGQFVRAFALPEIVTLGLDGGLGFLVYVGVLRILRDESLGVILKKLQRQNAARPA